jgi:hypothetical protein
MKSVFDWLNGYSEFVRKPGEAPVQIKIIERLTELIYVNHGSSDVTSFGRVIEGQGIYGRLGLTMPEALELLHLSGQLQGFLICLDNDEVTVQVKGMITAEIERVKKVGFKADSDKVRVEVYTESDLNRIKRTLGI